MKSWWIEHNGRKILYQDFANLFYNWQAVRDELMAVQEVVVAEPPNSILVISDFTNTEISGNLLPILNASSTSARRPSWGWPGSSARSATCSHGSPGNP